MLPSGNVVDGGGLPEVGDQRGSFEWFWYTDYCDSPWVPRHESGIIKAHCRGLEQCPSSGRYHWQGVIATYKKTTAGKLQKMLGWSWIASGAFRGLKSDGGHRMLNYCKKCNNYQEEGVWPACAGDRTDLKTAVNVYLTKGLDALKVSNPDLVLKYGKHRWSELRPELPLRNWEMKVFYRYGETGAHKSGWAYDTFGYGNVFRVQEMRQWDGYNGQHCVLVDEIKWKSWDTEWLLQLMDRYPFMVRALYVGMINFCSRVIVLTSKFPPEEVFEEERLPDFYRRCSAVYKCIPGEKLATEVLEWKNPRDFDDEIPANNGSLPVKS